MRIALLSLLLLAGCSSYADRVAAYCTQLGAPPGSAHYWDCVSQTQEIDQRDRAMYGGVAAAGVYSLSPPQPVYLIGR